MNWLLHAGLEYISISLDSFNYLVATSNLWYPVRFVPACFNDRSLLFFHYIAIYAESVTPVVMRTNRFEPARGATSNGLQSDVLHGVEVMK